MPAIPNDYDSDPERFRANMCAAARYTSGGDVHPTVARVFRETGFSPILDLGCGDGRFTRPARALGLDVTTFDLSAVMLGALDGPRVRGDAARLPFPSAAFAGAAALYMLYHLPEPSLALAECRRVLRPGGLLAVSAPSRYNDPELSAVLAPLPEGSFDAENGAEMVAGFFEILAVERWDGPYMTLPDRASLELYLHGRGCPCPPSQPRYPRLPPR